MMIGATNLILKLIMVQGNQKKEVEPKLQIIYKPQGVAVKVKQKYVVK